jgi:serine/threonine protein kinase
MNREVDYRTDLYSLGATFYYLLTKRYLFDEASGLDLLYSIIAKRPKSPHERNPNIPQQLSDIIMHLLEVYVLQNTHVKKNADDRYQSTYGIRRDIEKYITREVFVVGSEDICSEFHISQRLYGRTTELEILLDGFERVASGHLRTMLLLVAGYSGVGKTALISKLIHNN